VGKKRIRNVAGVAGSVSDADGGAASGGEMSESGKIKKLKLNPPAATSQGGTPQGSRAGSPTPIGSKGLGASRASSPESLRGKVSLDAHVFTACPPIELTCACRAKSRLYTGTFRDSKLPNSSRNPRRHTSNRYTKQ
jgi:hypothetical protein